MQWSYGSFILPLIIMMCNKNAFLQICMLLLLIYGMITAVMLLLLINNCFANGGWVPEILRGFCYWWQGPR